MGAAGSVRLDAVAASSFVSDRTSLLLPDGRPAATVATVFSRT